MTADIYFSEITRRGILPAIDPQYGGPYTIEQNPHELAAFCEWIQPKSIKNYLEVGVSTGGLLTFFGEYFGCERVYGADLRRPNSVPPNVGLFIGNTRSQEFVQWLTNLPRIHLAWIDADHSYESVKADAEIVERILSPQFMAFHDICGLRECEGSRKHWLETKEANPGKTVEFIAQDDTRVGIGVLIRD